MMIPNIYNYIEFSIAVKTLLNFIKSLYKIGKLTILFGFKRVKWPIIVLLALSNLYFFILLMKLEETLSPITKGELSLTLSSYFCQSKSVRKALKFLTSTEIPA